MLLQTTTRELELGLLLLVVALVGLVSYWVYRDADARGMDDAGYWGAAVGVAFVVGLIVGGLVAVAVYRSSRPEGYEGGQDPFDDLAEAEAGEAQDPAHADLPPAPELTAEGVANASPTALRGYARRYDELDATAEPETLRAALRALVDRGEAEAVLGTVRDGTDEPSPGEADDTRRHLGRPELRTDGTASAQESAPEHEEAAEAQGFEWVDG